MPHSADFSWPVPRADLETIEVLEAVSAIDGHTRWRERSTTAPRARPAMRRPSTTFAERADAFLPDRPATALTVAPRRRTPAPAARPTTIRIVVPKRNTAPVLERITLVAVGLVVGGALALVATPQPAHGPILEADRDAPVRSDAVRSSDDARPTSSPPGRPERTRGQTAARTGASPSPAAGDARTLTTRHPTRTATRAPARTAAGPLASPLRSATTAVDARTVLEGVRRFTAAYNRLDAAATEAVWRGIDRRQLVAAFTTLREQRLTLRRCVVEPDGPAAIANCRGTLRYRARVGDHSTRTREGPWRFVMARSPDGWIVERISAP